MKIKLILFLFLIAILASAQTKTWESDLVVTYKMTNASGQSLNSIEVKKDTIHYEWIEKEKVTNRMIVGDTALENKLLSVMNKYKILKFKSAKPATPGPNIILTHAKGQTRKTIVMPQHIKAGSKEELFIKEFMEPILLKAFAQEIKGFPK